MSIKLRNILLSIPIALLFSIVMAILTDQSSIAIIYFLAGFALSLVILFKVERAGFWYCITFAIEWALLPISVLARATHIEESGCAGVGAALAVTVFLAITIPIGAVGFVVFLVLALWRFKKPARRMEPD